MAHRYIESGTYVDGNIVIHIPAKQEFHRIVQVQPVNVQEISIGRIPNPKFLVDSPLNVKHHILRKVKPGSQSAAKHPLAMLKKPAPWNPEV